MKYQLQGHSLRRVPATAFPGGFTIVLLRGTATSFWGKRFHINETFHIPLVTSESEYDIVLRAMQQSSVEWKRPRKVRTRGGSAISTTRG